MSAFVVMPLVPTEKMREAGWREFDRIAGSWVQYFGGPKDGNGYRPSEGAFQYALTAAFSAAGAAPAPDLDKALDTGRAFGGAMTDAESDELHRDYRQLTASDDPYALDKAVERFIKRRLAGEAP